MSRYIPDTIRRFVTDRARYCCEYCLIHQDDAVFRHEIEHIISIKHGGDSKVENLAYSYVYCNRNKGADVGTVLPPANNFVRLFNPRLDKWDEHFLLNEGQILALTHIGEATIRVLDFNHFERLIERRDLIRDGRYLR